MTVTPSCIHLRNGGTSLFISVHADSLPEILYWGADLGLLDTASMAAFAQSQTIAVTSGTADLPPRLSLIPQQSEGWIGTPGLQGSHHGASQFSLFIPTAVTTFGSGTDSAPTSFELSARDAEADLAIDVEIHVEPSGLVRSRAILTNLGAVEYDLDSLLLAFPTPATEKNVIDQTGRHLREREIVTHSLTIGSHERTSRVARAHATSMIHGTCGDGPMWTTAPVHYVHVAWSGNTRTVVEKTPVGQQCLLAGELLMPGEIRLEGGHSYETPWIIATWGNGLNEAAQRIHGYLRARPTHPQGPRPVTLNAWEAVYFDHSLPRLLSLVDTAAALGVERFVLDDGWFSSRRDDTSGLGDWVISPDVWPDGLNPLADAVHAHGMQFGLWFEPEMVNPNSDVARAHPEWILSPAQRRPIACRHQQVFDLANPDVFDHVLTQILAVLDSVHVDYIKWDFNRDLFEAVSPRTGKPSYHAQTKATYALMDAILHAHPDLEIESCAGGGGRIDLGIMERAVRVWASDCIDPIERQLIEAGTFLLLPPELVGSHIASTTSHTTGRTLTLNLRASTALLSHMGIEWDLTEASDQDISELAYWIKLHKHLRPILHSGRLLHADHTDDTWNIRGVVSLDGNDAIFFVVHTASSAQRPTPPVRLPGLDDAKRYHLTHLHPNNPHFPHDGYHPPLPWWPDALTLPGRVWSEAGVRLPDLLPQQSLVLHLHSID
ncbi:alpha-galactosidase [Schaalia suimastitidis]|uniref:alpha-galactosidase n=1 Tax=Schaalia suimastitidis TaxID=121163 RepID=UPI00040633B7|nr:alpha-galactosidase [Schaalia suimastitidis]